MGVGAWGSDRTVSMGALHWFLVVSVLLNQFLPSLAFSVRLLDLPAESHLVKRSLVELPLSQLELPVAGESRIVKRSPGRGYYHRPYYRPRYSYRGRGRGRGRGGILGNGLITDVIVLGGTAIGAGLIGAAI